MNNKFCRLLLVEKFGHCTFVLPNQELIKVPKFLLENVSFNFKDHLFLKSNVLSLPVLNMIFFVKKRMT